MPEQRNYRFADDPQLQAGTPSAIMGGLFSPTSPEAAQNKAADDIRKDPNKAIEGLIEQQRLTSSNKQKLISSIIGPMKGLSDKPATGSDISDAEKYTTDLLTSIESVSGISEDAAVSMLLETWPFWQKNGNSWGTFEEFIKVAAKHFFNTQDVIEWSKNLFQTMQDGSPVFTPEYIMSVALNAVNTGNFTNYQNLLLSMPFYKAVWSKQPVDSQDFSKATSQIGLMMQAVQTPTKEMGIAMDNMIARYNLITYASTWYKGMLTYVVKRDTRILEEISRIMKDRKFTTWDVLESIINMQLQRYETEKIIRDGLKGQPIVNPQRPNIKTNSNKLFKTVLSVGSATTPGAGGSTSAGSGTSSTTTSTPLSDSQQKASNQANALNREALLIDKNQEIIQKKIEKINSISEGKAKGLTGDLGLFSSLVTSGNVVKEINETLKLIADQRVLIKKAITTNESWINRNPINSATPDALAAHHQTLSMNRKRYQVLGMELDGMEQALKIQRIVLPKELEYFELKEEYDTNVEQLKAPISALMVNSLKTTTDNKGRTTTINTRVARPIAIKNAWETGKKIVNLLMQISQALQAGTGHSAMGESMAKNASNYYKAAIKQEVENNKMLMDNLRDIGLGGGQVNYTPVAVGKK
jgi:hypothetical protein